MKEHLKGRFSKCLCRAAIASVVGAIVAGPAAYAKSSSNLIIVRSARTDRMHGLPERLRNRDRNPPAHCAGYGGDWHLRQADRLCAISCARGVDQAPATGWDPGIAGWHAGYRSVGLCGITGRVNNHYVRLVSGVVLGSTIGAGAQIGAGGE